MKYQIEQFWFNVETVGLDAGYNTSAICKILLEDFKIQAAMGERRGCQQKGKYGKYKFQYIPDWDVYICPERNYLEYVTIDRNGYKEYKCKIVALQNQRNCISIFSYRPTTYFLTVFFEIFNAFPIVL